MLFLCKVKVKSQEQSSPENPNLKSVSRGWQLNRQGTQSGRDVTAGGWGWGREGFDWAGIEEWPSVADSIFQKWLPTLSIPSVSFSVALTFHPSRSELYIPLPWIGVHFCNHFIQESAVEVKLYDLWGKNHQLCYPDMFIHRAQPLCCKRH